MNLDKRISDHLVRLVGIMFGVVVVQSFVRYDELIIDPFGSQYRIGIVALVVVYFTVVMSWVDWHTAMELRPYALNPNNASRRTELIRLWSDLAVVAVYAYLLLTIKKFESDTDQSIGPHLAGYALVFLTYFISGTTRRLTYGKYASNVRAITVFGALYAVLSVSYGQVWKLEMVSATWLNAAALAEAFLLMVLYRLVRRGASNARKKEKESGSVIGVDVDGVLANQIVGILPRIEERTGIKLSYEDVTEWKLPLNHTDIATEILAAMDDDSYILEMPAHQGAQKVMETLYDSNRIYVITARPPEAKQSTEQWLTNNKIPYDRIVNVKEEKKSLYRTDILIDDYVGNVIEFLTNTNGRTILIDQPWNRDRSSLQEFMASDRLHVGEDLNEALAIVQGDYQSAESHSSRSRGDYGNRKTRRRTRTIKLASSLRLERRSRGS